MTENHKCDRENETGEDSGSKLEVGLLNSRSVYVDACVCNQVFTANYSSIKAHVRCECDELHFLFAPLAIILVDLETSTTVILAPKRVGVIYVIRISKLRDHFNGTHYALLGVVGHVEP